MSSSSGATLSSLGSAGVLRGLAQSDASECSASAMIRSSMLAASIERVRLVRGAGRPADSEVRLEVESLRRLLGRRSASRDSARAGVMSSDVGLRRSLVEIECRARLGA